MRSTLRLLTPTLHSSPIRTSHSLPAALLQILRPTQVQPFTLTLSSAPIRFFTSTRPVMSSNGNAKITEGSWKTSIDKDSGEFKRKASQFRDWIMPDGSGPFPPAAGRYHLYVCLACPWAHRTLIVRALKGLEKVISVTVVDWHLGERGWTFTDSKPKCEMDPVHGFETLREVYENCKPGYDGNVTVPVLYDKETKKIVNNESSEIIQMLNNAFNKFSATPEQAALDLYPDDLKKDVDEINSWVYEQINNGVYRCGFARSQSAYESAFDTLFAALDRVESILSKQRYLVSNERITLADVRLFTTLIRFDTVYECHFKCNKKRISQYPNLHNYMLELYQNPAIKPTIDQQHICQHYYGSHKTINPTGIVAKGPSLDIFDVPHDRDKKFPIKQKA